MGGGQEGRLANPPDGRGDAGASDQHRHDDRHLDTEPEILVLVVPLLPRFWAELEILAPILPEKQDARDEVENDPAQLMDLIKGHGSSIPQAHFLIGVAMVKIVNLARGRRLWYNTLLSLHPFCWGCYSFEETV